MDLLEKLVRRVAKSTTRNGKIVIVTDGDSDLVEAFAQLGWADAHDPSAVSLPATPEAAVLGPPTETASEKRPRTRGSR
jgi:hypothetical protein